MVRERFSFETEFDKIKEIINYYNLGFGTCEIAKIYDLNRWTILEILKRNGVKPKRISRPYKNKFNINFFKEYSNESVYWAGFIFADGNIHTKKQVLQIALHKQDEDHLEKFKSIIDFTGPIYTDTSNDSRKIIVAGKWFAQDLYKNYNIGSNKSLTIKFPEQIPEKYLPHFIRGIFDGDGSLTHSSNSKRINNAINFTGNIYVISKIRQIFLSLLEINEPTFAKMQINKRNDLIGSINFSCKKAKSILDWLYIDSNDSIRLKRKYDKYMLFNQKVVNEK